jgi:hypothetical protein
LEPLLACVTFFCDTQAPFSYNLSPPSDSFKYHLPLLFVVLTTLSLSVPLSPWVTRNTSSSEKNSCSSCNEEISKVHQIDCIALQRHVLCWDEMRAQEALETARSVIVRSNLLSIRPANDLTYRVLVSVFDPIFGWLKCLRHVWAWCTYSF